MASVEQISAFDILKIGIGPSSSHTLGPWRAAQRFLHEAQEAEVFEKISSIQVKLYGSLAKTGKGHATDTAVILSLSGEEVETIATDLIVQKVDQIRQNKTIQLLNKKSISFDPAIDIHFLFQEKLAFHPNGIRFIASIESEEDFQRTYFSIGGGFVVKEGEALNAKEQVKLPYPCANSKDLLAYSIEKGSSIFDLVWENETVWRTPEAIRTGILKIWQVMKECVYRGCHAEGKLPGGLNVIRRAPMLAKKLMKSDEVLSIDQWMQHLMQTEYSFSEVLKWISCFAIAVNEENAAFGRVVTAPTNGASGVIPAVLMYYLCFNVKEEKEADIIRFLLITGEIGSYFKKGATISAAMGGCQAEIGVSSSMAAAALTECLGGNVEQALMAAEIAMEHHLGLTCDPVAGLVQIPCIERNSMGAIKAITASHIALESDPKQAKVSLDNVIKTMWETAQDMNEKYKETSEGGLAINIPVNVPEC